MDGLNISGAFTYFSIPITQTTISSLMVTAIIIFASIKLGKRLKKRPDGVQVIVFGDPNSRRCVRYAQRITIVIA